VLLTGRRSAAIEDFHGVSRFTSRTRLHASWCRVAAMSRRLLVPALVIALLPACKNEHEDKPAVEVQPGKAPPAESSAGQPEQPTTAVAPSETGGAEETETGDEVPALAPMPDEFEKVGVASCDEYVASYVACIAEKVPEAEREAQRRIVFDNVTSWKQTAAGGGAAEKGLQTACKIAAEQAKRATRDWGCTW
jgi:hypothetical protein